MGDVTCRLRRTLGALLCGLLFFGVSGQPAPATPSEEPLEEMRTLLREGLYALAAQVEGPELVQALPESAEARRLYARALYLTGDLAAAEAQLAEAAALGASGAEHARLDALVAAARGDLSRAQRLLETTFAQAPSYGVAMDLGRVAWQAGDFGGALSAYEAAAGTPEGAREPWPHLHRAKLLALGGEYEGAVEAWNTALNVLDDLSLAEDSAEGRAGSEVASALPSPAYAQAFYGLGEAYEALGELKQAAANYAAALAADPSFDPAAEALARLGTSP